MLTPRPMPPFFFEETAQVFTKPGGVQVMVRLSGLGWGPLWVDTFNSLLYVVVALDGEPLAVCSSLRAASVEADCWRQYDLWQDVRITRSDGLEVQEGCDQCPAQGEAFRMTLLHRPPRYLCVLCQQALFLGLPRSTWGSAGGAKPVAAQKAPLIAQVARVGYANRRFETHG
jgi:hypothetical protein